MSSEYSEQKEFYNASYESGEHGRFGFPDLKIVDHNPDVAGKKILSVGGGNGSDVRFLADKNEVFLIDGSAVAVEQAKNCGIIAQAGDVGEKLPFADGNFDVVILKDILEHIYNPADLLKEAKRVLKDDGYIIISLPNHFYLPFRLRILLGGNLIWKSLLHNHKKYFEEWDYMHVRFFTWRGTRAFVKKLGLKIDKCYWDFGTLAHYNDPLMHEYAFKLNNKKIERKKQWLMYKIFLPGYKIFNFIFPKKLRGWIVSLAPGLLCAGFYLKVKKI